MSYQPIPMDTSSVELTDDILELIELLARNTHEVWAQHRLADGWRYGPHLDDGRKQHPSLVPYEELPESEKQYDRNTVIQALKVIASLGYCFRKG